MDVFFLTPKEQILNGQLTARVKASGKALRAYPTTLPRESQITMALAQTYPLGLKSRGKGQTITGMAGY